MVDNKNEIVPYADIEKMGTALCASKLFGMQTEQQAVALLLLAQAEGMHPAAAVRDYHIIQNKPSLKADAMLARFQAAGGKVQWVKYTDTEVVGKFSHPMGGEITLDWTIDRAKKAGLLKNPTWHKYPRNMLRSRVISEAIKTVFPGVSAGMYTPEEVQDFTHEDQPKDDSVVDVEVVEKEEYEYQLPPVKKFLEALDWFADNKKTVADLDKWFAERTEDLSQLSDGDQVRVQNHLAEIKGLLAPAESKIVIDC